jgi:RNA polymerase sigma-70 factor (ECF subfamily)
LKTPNRVIFGKLEKERQLIEGCRDGKNSAREELYTTYSKQLLAICYRYTGDWDSAHDVLHDAFIKIFTHFSFRGESSLLTWLTKVVTAQAIDFLRSRQRMMKFETSKEDLPDVPELIEAPSDETLSEKQLLDYIAELPDGCRAVFNLFVFEHKSHKEIAKLLNIKEHSSTSQLHYAKVLLANRINEYRNNEERKR